MGLLVRGIPAFLKLKATVFAGFWLGVLAHALDRGLWGLAGVAGGQFVNSLAAFASVWLGGNILLWLWRRDRGGG